MTQFTGRTDTVFLTRLTGFQRPEATNLTFNRDAAGVGHVHNLPGHTRVVVIIHRRFTILAERTIHHDGTEPKLDRTLTDRGRRAVVLMDDDRHMGELGHGGFHQCTQKRRTRVLPRTRARLHDHRRIRLISRFHDGSRLLKVVHVKGGHAIAVLRRVVQ